MSNFAVKRQMLHGKKEHDNTFWDWKPSKKHWSTSFIACYEKIVEALYERLHP